MFECDSEQVMTMFTWHVPGPFVEKPKNKKRPQIQMEVILLN